MSATEVVLQLPPDSGDNKNKIRMLQLLPLDGDGATLELQEVVAIADAAGTLLGLVDGGAIPAADETSRLMMRGMLARLDLIASALVDNYEPPDELGLAG